jgi:F-type H+-transporting ATPase subunit alpha
VVLDDLSPLLNCWEALVLALADLGPALLREGLIKDEEVGELLVVAAGWVRRAGQC